MPSLLGGVQIPVTRSIQAEPYAFSKESVRLSPFRVRYFAGG